MSQLTLEKNIVSHAFDSIGNAKNLSKSHLIGGHEVNSAIAQSFLINNTIQLYEVYLLGRFSYYHYNEISEKIIRDSIEKAAHDGVRFHVWADLLDERNTFIKRLRSINLDDGLLKIFPLTNGEDRMMIISDGKNYLYKDNSFPGYVDFNAKFGQGKEKHLVKFNYS